MNFFELQLSGMNIYVVWIVCSRMESYSEYSVRLDKIIGGAFCFFFGVLGMFEGTIYPYEKGCN